MRITTSFTEAVVLKSGNTKLVTLEGESYYRLAGAGFIIPMNTPVTVEVEKENKSGKEVLVITSIVPATTPSLPKTTITETVAPGGESPVKPAAKKETKVPGYSSDYQKPWLPEEAHRVAILNILTATLQSPAVGQAVVGRNSEEIKAIIKETFEEAVKLYSQAVER